MRNDAQQPTAYLYCLIAPLMATGPEVWAGSTHSEQAACFAGQRSGHRHRGPHRKSPVSKEEPRNLPSGTQPLPEGDAMTRHSSA